MALERPTIALLCLGLTGCGFGPFVNPMRTTPPGVEIGFKVDYSGAVRVAQVEAEKFCGKYGHQTAVLVKTSHERRFYWYIFDCR